MVQGSTIGGRAVDSSGMVYIVDDEIEILEILSGIVSAAGFQAFTFTEPEKMLSHFNRVTPDLVLSDLRMPGITGIEILSEIRKINPDVPLVLISGYLDTETLLEAISEGVFGAIQKPFDPDRVIEICTKAIEDCQINRQISHSLIKFLFAFDDLKDFQNKNSEYEKIEALDSEIRFFIKHLRKRRFLFKS
jgi:DNA-binding NtrC family response regulator